MIFMYPWTRVITVVGASSVIEMFTFLGRVL
jgi:NADH-quinone oxidoreductase subunit A